MRRLLLARHGESEWNASGRWQGRADPPLTPLGRKQAMLAVDNLGTVDAIVSSTLQRAAETALIISEGLGVGPVLFDEDLVERDAGEWQGLTRAEIEAAWPGYLANQLRPPSYELDEPLVERVLVALDRVCASVPGDHILVITHGGVINALERSMGLEWQRIPNLGGRWFAWKEGTLHLGDRVELIDHAVVTIQDRDQL
ncbi:MAG TPA: histidine phosphatase family protein [Acidimicrobiales bacterium]